MKPRLSAVTVMGLFAAAMVVWLVFRSHFPSSAEQVSTRPAPAGSQAPSEQTVAPSLSIAAGDSSPAAPSPQSSVAALAQGSPPSPPVASTGRISPAPAGSDPDAARADAASADTIKVRRMVTDYHTVNGENPVGTNAAVMGRNLRQAVLAPPEGVNLNSKGELVDAWGTPYFFHQLSRDVMEIHSAVPDKIKGTADDIVVR